MEVYVIKGSGMRRMGKMGDGFSHVLNSMIEGRCGPYYAEHSQGSYIGLSRDWRVRWSERCL